jgi:hypothetical protein
MPSAASCRVNISTKLLEIFADIGPALPLIRFSAGWQRFTDICHHQQVAAYVMGGDVFERKLMTNWNLQVVHAAGDRFERVRWNACPGFNDYRGIASTLDLGRPTERLCESLGQHGWHILRDSNVLRSGDLISGFMKRIGLADHVIVVLSDKYLRSPYCMTELYSIYQRSVGEKEDLLRRIIPLQLADARFGTPEERVEYASIGRQDIWSWSLISTTFR